MMLAGNVSLYIRGQGFMDVIFAQVQDMPASAAFCSATFSIRFVIPEAHHLQGCFGGNGTAVSCFVMSDDAVTCWFAFC